MWRAEVGPRLPGGRPRLVCSPDSGKISFECLVLTEVGDRQSQRIDGDEFVGHAGLENKNEVGSIELALQLAVISGRVVHHVKIHAGAVGWCLQFLERDLLHVDVDFGSRGVGQEFPDDVVLPIGVEDAVGELAVEEVERLCEVVLDGVAVPPVEELREFGEKVFRFGVLWFVLEIVIIDRFCSPEVVDTDDERPEVLEGTNGTEIDEGERYGDKRYKNESDLEVGISHHRVTVRFEVEPLGVVKESIAVHHSSLAIAAPAAAGASRIPAELPPAVPLKMWLVSAGTFNRT